MQESAALPPTDPDSLQQAIHSFRVYCGVVLHRSRSMVRDFETLLRGDSSPGG